MLDSAWESVAGEFVNASCGEVAIEALGDLYKQHGDATVVVGRDSRASSPTLASLVMKGVQDADAEVIDIGIVTTPQLHFVIRAKHRGEPDTIDDYYLNLRNSFKSMCGAAISDTIGLVVDCSNGVGAIAMNEIKDLIPNTVLINNFPGTAPLNDKCGADYVQKSRACPTTHKSNDCNINDDVIWASLDGDADRLVCYVRDGDDNFILADGDRFATLMAQQIAYTIKAAGLENVTIGVGQTAYSNGAATDYLMELPGVQVVDSKTGVKHLEKAVENFDVGIYWEPNGHGTVLYSDEFRSVLQNAQVDGNVEYLKCIGMLANQAVGDGVADLLLVMGIMIRKNISFKDWMGIYHERMTANGVVKVNDKSMVKTENFDKTVVAPSALRSRMMKVCDGNVRAFVRPSGTEDVVRVFAEAEDQETADETALEILRAVYDTCDGVGERP